MEENWREKIGELNRKLVDEYSGATDFLEELLSVQSDLGLLYGDRPTIPFLRPLFLPRALYDRIMHSAQQVALAGERLTYAALEDQKLLDRFDLTEAEEVLVRVDPGYEAICTSSRLDTFFSKDSFSFLEYNAETPSGPSDQFQIEQVFSKIEVLQEFLSQTPHWRPRPRPRLLEAMVVSYRQHGGREHKPNIAIIDWEGVSTEPEFYVLKDYFESLGYRTLVADPSDFEYTDGALRAGSFRVDIMYKRVLIHELLGKYGLDHPIVEAYRAGDLCMVNSFRVKIPHKKMSFSIFSDPAYADLFTDEQLRVFDKHIPWTRKLEDAKTDRNGREVGLLEFVRDNRERLILKPNDDYGGKGIVIGWETDQGGWESAIEDGLEDSFVVQERVPVEMEEFPMFEKDVSLETLLVDFDPYLFNNEPEGGMVRLSSSSLVNATQGGGQTALVVLED